MKRRRGFILLDEWVMSIPVITAIMVVGYQLADRSMRLQSGMRREMTARAVMRDLVRRVQRDAAQAQRASIREVDGEQRLALVSADREVVYAARGGQVTRVERLAAASAEKSADRPGIKYAWAARGVRVSFCVEPISGSPGVVWIHAELMVPVERCPAIARQLAAAAAVGQGGAR